MKILHVVGARPNFMKVAPVYRALRDTTGFSQTVVHTGQHYDSNMSDVFFEQLEIPRPDINLQVGSGSHARQTAAVMDRIEPVIAEQRPALVLVYGDVNSTVAATLVCAKLNVSVGHVEAGLRSFDRSMPEEINRIVTDSLADVLFTPSEDGNKNLMREGVPREKICFVGNVMIDSLLHLLPLAEDCYESLAGKFGLKEFGLVTMHRPSNVDEDETLLRIVNTLTEISQEIPLIFPMHPRTRQRLTQLAVQLGSGLLVTEPLGYLQFLALEQHAKVVITDSGGVQEETTWLGVPCLTVRENTERPVTVSLGTNMLVGKDMVCLKQQAQGIVAGSWKKGTPPPLWDGNAACRISQAIVANVWRSPFPASLSSSTK